MTKQISKTIKVNWAVQPETVEIIHKLQEVILDGVRLTPSDVIDHLAAQEYARRYSQPNPCVTVGEAQEAGQHA
jgi:hypothetical protein